MPRFLKRGHLLVAINGQPVDLHRGATTEPFSTALDLLEALPGPPCSMEFARPPGLADIKAVPGSPGLYDATFSEAVLGIEIAAFGEVSQLFRRGQSLA